MSDKRKVAPTVQEAKEDAAKAAKSGKNGLLDLILKEIDALKKGEVENMQRLFAYHDQYQSQK